ncbi:MAG TPA: ABC transporter substrate-binding protein [Baekduia sp.]
MRIIHPRRMAMCLLVAAAAALSACGSSDSDSGSGSAKSDGSTGHTALTIGFVGALTGPLSASGNDALAGLKAGVAYVNAQHGPYTYRIASRDSGGDPTHAVAATRELAQGHVAGIYFTTEAFPAVQQILNQTKTIGISPGIGPILDQAGDGKADPWAFSTGTAAGLPAVAPHIAYAQAGGGPVAELSEASAYGQSQAALTAAQAKQTPGLKIVSRDFPTTARDVSKQLGDLQASGAKTLVVWTYGQGLVTVIQDLKKVGWAPRLAGPLAFADPAIVKAAPASLLANAVAGPMPKTFLATQPGQAPTGIAAEFVKRYLAATGKQQFAGLDEVGAFSFDTAIVLDAAARTAHGADATKMKAALTSGTPISGAQGRYVFGPDQRIGLGADQLGLFKAGEPCDAGTCIATG